MNSVKTKGAINALYKTEFSLQKKSIIWWFCILGILTIIELAMYPLMNYAMQQMPDDVMKKFDELGVSFSFENVTAYFLLQAVETIALGGALFSCCFIANAMMRDFKGGQSEFLYTNGLSRSHIAGTKYATAVTMTAVYEFVIFALSLIVMAIVDYKTIDMVAILSLFLNCLALHLILMTITFAIFLLRPKKSGYGVAIAVPLILYFFCAIALSITPDSAMKFIEYLTPFTPLYDISIEKPFDVNFYATIIYVAFAIALTFWGVKRFKNRDF